MAIFRAGAVLNFGSSVSESWKARSFRRLSPAFAVSRSGLGRRQPRDPVHSRLVATDCLRCLVPNGHPPHLATRRLKQAPTTPYQRHRCCGHVSEDATHARLGVKNGFLHGGPIYAGGLAHVTPRMRASAGRASARYLDGLRESEPRMGPVRATSGLRSS